MNKYKEFFEMHHRQQPLVLGNVWDAKSAEVMQREGAVALGTSSAAIAHIMGYEDGEKLSFDELLFVVERIAAKVSVPLSVDVESGYGEDISEVVDNVEKLCLLGVAGINIEDSRVGEQRELLPAGALASLIREIRKYLEHKGLSLFINARTDTFLLGVGSALEETLERAALYKEAGADGLFVPCMVNEADIRTVTSGTRLPVNVMCMPGLPSFDRLAGLGVKRISMGNFVHSHLMDIFTQTVRNIRAEGSFNTLF